MSVIAGAVLCLALGGYWIYVWSLYGDEAYLERGGLEDDFND